MRQAGRYMKDYRELRKGRTILDICRSPELSSAAASLPVEKFDLDAAILFSDIMVPLMEMGMDISIVDEVGPVIGNPLRSAADMGRLRELDPSSLSFVYDSIRETRKRLNERVPVIGFAGAPFTLASYLVEGRGTRTYSRVKRLMYTDSEGWSIMMQRLSSAVTGYLLGQISAGCRAVQLFDSWAGALSASDYSRYVLPYTEQITRKVAETGIPVINFSTGNSALIPLMKCEGVSAVSVDWRTDIADAWKMIGYDTAIQGNLDPAVLLGGRDQMIEKARQILEKTAGRNGHIFNLGHGILKETPEENVAVLVDFVKREEQS